MQAEGQSYTPYRIKSALVNSSKLLKIPDPFGVGMVQVNDAWSLLNTINSNASFDCHYQISFPSWRKNAGGLYFRGGSETKSVQQHSCNIKPRVFREDSDLSNPGKLAQDFNLSLRTSVPWINVPKFLHLCYSGRAFDVRVDPTSLEPGLHFGVIEAYDESCGNPIFSVPVTVCKPIEDNSSNMGLSLSDVRLQSGDVRRYFLDVPFGCNFSRITVKGRQRDVPSIYVIVVTQILNQSRYDACSKTFHVRLGNKQTDSSEENIDFEQYFKVIPGIMLEVTVAPYWSAGGMSDIDLEIQWHGIQALVSGSNNGSDAALAAAGGGILINSGVTGISVCILTQFSGFTRVDLLAPLRRQNIGQVVCRFEKFRRFQRPDEFTLKPLGSRDILPNGKQLHSAILSYKLDFPEPVKLTPRFPRFEGYCYDSAQHSFSHAIVDENGRILYFANQDAKEVSLSKGKFTITANIVSDDPSMLDRLRGILY